MYSPALRQQKAEEVENIRLGMEAWLNNFRETNQENGKSRDELLREKTAQLCSNLKEASLPKAGTDTIINDKTSIDLFVDKMREALEKESARPDPNASDIRKSREQELAEQAILNAEKFKADIHTTGMDNDNSVPPVDLNFDDNKDEEFSEGTCHVDQVNILKVCKGQFVEVAKLIPKQQAIKQEEGKRLELVNKDGMTYYIPSITKENRK